MTDQNDSYPQHLTFFDKIRAIVYRQSWYKKWAANRVRKKAANKELASQHDEVEVYEPSREVVKNVKFDYNGPRIFFRADKNLKATPDGEREPRVIRFDKRVEDNVR